ncbi:hypothetical protein RMSM_03525, partial [Rhodopirellula maiorica SM1]
TSGDLMDEAMGEAAGLVLAAVRGTVIRATGTLRAIHPTIVPPP